MITFLYFGEIPILSSDVASWKNRWTIPGVTAFVMFTEVAAIFAIAFLAGSQHMKPSVRWMLKIVIGLTMLILLSGGGRNNVFGILLMWFVLLVFMRSQFLKRHFATMVIVIGILFVAISLSQ